MQEKEDLGVLVKKVIWLPPNTKVVVIKSLKRIKKDGRVVSNSAIKTKKR